MNLSGNTATKRLKAVGGIIVLGSWFDENGNVVTAANDHRTTTGFNDILIENNVIQRVGLEEFEQKLIQIPQEATLSTKRFLILRFVITI